MPVVQYPFIDIAVHERVREGFANGEAIVLFSDDMRRVLWANGAGARLFAKAPIYDFLEDGPNGADITFRQVEAAAQQLREPGDIRHLTIRIAQGFRRTGVQGKVEHIATPAGEPAILFSVPLHGEPLPLPERASQMLTGFDDDDTHMAVLDKNGDVIAASPGFASLGVTDHTARTLATMVGHDPDRLMKRPIPTGRGYLPAAIGRISDEPGLHLLFVVEMAIGNLDPTDDFAAQPSALPQAPDSGSETVTNEPDIAAVQPDADDFDGALDAVAQIADVDEESGSFSADAPPLEEARADIDDGADAAGADDRPTASDAIATAVAALPQPASDDGESGFRFDNSMRAIRFVWKIDADGRFSDISGEFAKAVGPHAASVRGMAFTDMAHLFQLDTDGTIAELLGKRDTWSGKTIYWPVEGTSLRVPVDLAALPTYTRDREFDGFRGFGIVRPADAVPDPLEMGLYLAAGAYAAPDTNTEPDEAAEESTEALEGAVTAPDDAGAAGTQQATKGESHAEAGASGEAGEPAVEQPFMRMPWGEIPALKITDPAKEASPDEAGKQYERRARGDTLTPGEQAAFREIARRLESLTRADDEDGPEPATDESAAPEPEVESEETHEAPSESSAETDEVGSVAAPVPDVERLANAGPQELREVLAAFIPPRSQMNEGMTPASIDALPAALLVHAGDELIHANPAFLALTGFESLQAIEAVGGLDSLLSRSDVAADSALTLVRADDTLVDVTAQLKSIRWEQGHALMLTLAPVDSDGVTGSAAPDSDDTPALSTSEDDMPEETFEALADVPPADKSSPVTDDACEPADETVQEAEQDSEDATPEDPAASGPDSPEPAQENPDVEEPAGDDTAADGTMAEDPAVEEVAEPQEAGDTMAPAPSEAALPAARLADELLEKVAMLRGEVEELRSILETATDGVVVLGPDYGIRSVNRSASALFNYDIEEVRGKPFVMLFAHESQKSVVDYLNMLAGDGVASVLNDGREVIGREASGGFIPMFMTMGRLSASDGYCAVIRDITQWKRTEEELRNAKRAAETANAHKSDFLARVSHEIRTPLNAIIGFSDMMATERFGTIGHPRYIEYANDIGRSGRHVLDIVNDLLDISKIEAGEMELDFIEVGLNETILEAVSLVQPQANSQRVIIRTALSNALPHVVADLRSIKQIALNILANSIRFTPSGGQIVVSTTHEANGSVVMRIRDTGVGMTRSELEQAMKPFRQVTTGTRARGDGTGLGLPLTKAMVDANRAQFAISSAPNEGTLVEITFPSSRVLAD